MAELLIRAGAEVDTKDRVSLFPLRMSDVEYITTLVIIISICYIDLVCKMYYSLEGLLCIGPRSIIALMSLGF